MIICRRISLTLHHAASWLITHICCTKEWIKTRELIKNNFIVHLQRRYKFISINSKATSNSELLVLKGFLNTLDMFNEFVSPAK